MDSLDLKHSLRSIDMQFYLILKSGCLMLVRVGKIRAVELFWDQGGGGFVFMSHFYFTCSRGGGGFIHMYKEGVVIFSKSQTKFSQPNHNKYKCFTVQLWTVNNYHWYLKQHLAFSAVSEERVTCLAWDPEHAYRMHIVCQGGQYLQYTWSWATNHSIGQTTDDLTQVAVIDGGKCYQTYLIIKFV